MSVDFIPNKGRNELTLVINNREIIIENAKLIKTMDTGCDAFSCTMPWFPGLDTEIDDITARGSFSEACIYIAGKLQMTGILYYVKEKEDSEGIAKELKIYTKTADMIDSTWQHPFEQNKIDIYDLCVNQAENFDITVAIDNGASKGGIFSRINVKQTDLCFKTLVKLAAQRGLIISCNEYGQLLLVKPNTNGKPIGTLQKENPFLILSEIEYDGRKRYYEYNAITSSSSSNRTQVKQKSIDESIPSTRFLTFSASDSLPGEGKNAAEFKRNKTAAEAFNLNPPSNTWYGPDNKLWTPNTLISVKNPLISENGFTFLITYVEFNYNSDGLPAGLNLIPPSMYELGNIEEP